MYLKIELKAPQMSQTNVIPYVGVPWTFSMRTSHLSVNKFQNLVKVSYIGTTSVECKKNYFSTCWSQLVYLVTICTIMRRSQFFRFQILSSPRSGSCYSVVQPKGLKGPEGAFRPFGPVGVFRRRLLHRNGNFVPLAP